MSKTGIVLFNIGTPASYEVPDVKSYLQTFLMDKDVINLPFILRWILVNGIIAPRRAVHSAANYKKVWMKEGSPLYVHTKHFADKLQAVMGDNFVVKIGMRYSEPSTSRALDELAQAGVKDLILVPMFPQWAEATSGSALRDVHQQIKEKHLEFKTRTINYFYNAPAFIKPSAELVKEAVAGKEVDHYLFSFHGLPESHVRKVEGCLRKEDCCFEKNACEKPCYRAQCFATASAIANELQIQPSHWSVSFQSRLGRAEWLKPSTDHSIKVLAETGRKKIAVICPAFVADCIETLEEIGMGSREVFHEAGGTEFTLVPCVNDDDRWVEGFKKLL